MRSAIVMMLNDTLSIDCKPPFSVCPSFNIFYLSTILVRYNSVVYVQSFKILKKTFPGWKSGFRYGLAEHSDDMSCV